VNLSNALEAMDRSDGISLRDTSNVLKTKPVDNLDQPDFLNQVASIETSLPPKELLNTLQGIENALGRKRKTWKGPRTIDLDILLYDKMVLEDPDLTIPHPELRNRPFFLRQILEIAPDTVDPVSNRSLSSLLDETRDKRVPQPGEADYDR
jgi:2-amino-4-hydroxy-6-hydroxymethyldihydropteridine diphosphokinase